MVHLASSPKRHPFKMLISKIVKLYTLFSSTKQYYQLSLRRLREVSGLQSAKVM